MRWDVLSNITRGCIANWVQDSLTVITVLYIKGSMYSWHIVACWNCKGNKWWRYSVKHYKSFWNYVWTFWIILLCFKMYFLKNRKSNPRDLINAGSVCPSVFWFALLVIDWIVLKLWLKFFYVFRMRRRIQNHLQRRNLLKSLQTAK